MHKIRIEAGSVIMTATLNNTETADRIWNALPIESAASVWGKEVYFEIPVKAGEENAQAKVPSGTVAYWPVGHCLCLFFGQTPYSPVNVVGQLDGDPNEFAAVNEGDTVKLRKSE